MRIVILLFVIIPVFCRAQVASVTESFSVSIPDTVIVEDTTVYSPGSVEKEASFPGLNSYIMSKLRYPANSDSIVSSRPVVAFIIEKDGSVSHIRSVKKESPPDPLARELMLVIGQMPKWQPAQIAGKNVRVEIILPMHICFKG